MLVDPECDRYDGKTTRTPPSDCPSRYTFPGSVCATSPRIGGRVPLCYSWLPHLGRREMSTVTRLPAATAGQTPRHCPRGGCAGSRASRNAHTRPATGPLLGVQYPYEAMGEAIQIVIARKVSRRAAITL